MFALYVTALLCLVSVSNSATLVCEDLVRPLDQLDLHHLVGRWALIAGNPAHEENFKSRDSASINFVNETSKMSFMRVFSFGGSCQYMSSNITFGGSSFKFDKFNITVNFLYTSCPDCVVMRFDNRSKNLLRLYLFSRRREVKQEETEEFGAQSKCLNMLPPIIMDPTKELCPEQISSDPTVQNEENTEGQKA